MMTKINKIIMKKKKKKKKSLKDDIFSQYGEFIVLKCIEILMK